MGWGQRAARFFCEVRSARKHPEVILSDAHTGVNIVLAGEYGALRIRVRGTNAKEVDRFEVTFEPWRKSKHERGEVTLVTGVLNFDQYVDGGGDGLTVRLDDDVVNLYRERKAARIMAGSDT